jgi:hypothetical protein
MRTFLASVMCFTIYFIPTGVAMLRNHHNAGAIFALNFLLGWTVIGWVAALVWSLTSQAPSQQPVVVNVQPGPGGQATETAAPAVARTVAEFCPQCGKRRDGTLSFCRSCGTSLA